MTKAILPVAMAFILFLGGTGVSGESFIGIDENGNQVQVVDGWIVGTAPGATVPSAPPAPRHTVAPAPRYSKGVGHGPSGRLEYNPYDPKKWWRDTPGMIDQINRDYPPPRRSR